MLNRSIVSTFFGFERTPTEVIYKQHFWMSLVFNKWHYMNGFVTRILKMKNTWEQSTKRWVFESAMKPCDHQKKSTCPHTGVLAIQLYCVELKIQMYCVKLKIQQHCFNLKIQLYCGELTIQLHCVKLKIQMYCGELTIRLHCVKLKIQLYCVKLKIQLFFFMFKSTHIYTCTW